MVTNSHLIDLEALHHRCLPFYAQVAQLVKRKRARQLGLQKELDVTWTREKWI